MFEIIEYRRLRGCNNCNLLKFMLLKMERLRFATQIVIKIDPCLEAIIQHFSGKIKYGKTSSVINKKLHITFCIFASA